MLDEKKSALRCVRSRAPAQRAYAAWQDQRKQPYQYDREEDRHASFTRGAAGVWAGHHCMRDNVICCGV